MKQYILALDEGTTSARAILFDRHSNIISMAQHEIAQIYPHPGWVEQDPMDIYANQYAALTECIAKSGIDPDEIAAVGVTNQRETVVAWDRRTGKPICNAIVWQCRRTADICRALDQAGYAEEISALTGLRLDPYFSGTKIKWMLDNVRGAKQLAKEGHLMVGTVDSWLIYKLSEGRIFVTDRTNASRTMLCNVHTGEWEPRMLDILDIPRDILPEIKSSSEIYGYFECMGSQLPIAGIAGDQQAALFGQCCFEAGEAKNTYGTGCFLLAHTGEQAVHSKQGLLTTIAATEAGKPIEYALEGSVFVGGAVVRWLRDEMKLIDSAKESEAVALQAKDSAGVYVVPAFAGLGAPYWDMHARGSILGLTAGAGRAHVVRAALESIAYQTEDVLHAMDADMHAMGVGEIARLRVDGGASANDLLMQMQSDLSGIEVERSANPEATAAGAAYLAGLAVGFYHDREELKHNVSAGKTFSPAIGETARRQRLNGWHCAVKACRAFAEGEA
ncbi:MAG: glycerol kinase GlpK [Ruminococcaceae bacterium]|nr:glycerol kinase GlpK [Oscillospiraceae bacterium]